MLTAGFAGCSWLAWRASRREGNVGHLWIAVAFATNPLLFVACLLWPTRLAGFELAYYFALPSLIAGITILAASLIRARRGVEAELARRIAAENALRELNASLEARVEAARMSCARWSRGSTPSIAACLTICAVRSPA